MKLNKPFIIVLFLFSVLWTVVGASEYKLEIALVYKVSKFVYWPEKSLSEQASFGVCILGNTHKGKAFFILQKRKIKSLPIKIYNLNYSDEIDSQCQVVVIDPSRNVYLDIILKEIIKKPLLTLSSMEGFAKKGGMIEFLVKTKPIKFAINLDKLKSSGIDVILHY